MTTTSESSSSGPPATTTGDPSSTTAVAGTSGTTAADGTSTGASTDGSSGTTGLMLACGQSLDPPGGCDPACTQCNAGLCLIFCGDGDCTGDTIACPEDRPCRVDCSGDDACRDATVVCPPGHECSVRCLGASCGNLDVMCGAGKCMLDCITSDVACDGAQFHCGSNEGTVTCNLGHENPPDLVPSDSECSCESIGC